MERERVCLGEGKQITSIAGETTHIHTQLVKHIIIDLYANTRSKSEYKFMVPLMCL